MNQSAESVVTSVVLNNLLVGNISKGNVNVMSGKNATKIVDGEFKVTVAANGLTAIKIEGVEIEPSFQAAIIAQTKEIGNSYIDIDFGNAKAMLFNLGNLNKRAYIYLQDNDAIFKNVTLNFTDKEGQEVSITKNHFPYEFTIPLDENQTKLNFNLSGISVDGTKEVSNNYILGEYHL